MAEGRVSSSLVVEYLDEVEEAILALPQLRKYSPSSCLTVENQLCVLFIHPRASNLISLRSAGTMPA